MYSREPAWIVRAGHTNASASSQHGDQAAIGMRRRAAERCAAVEQVAPRPRSFASPVALSLPAR
jgi:hypothetical protein